MPGSVLLRSLALIALAGGPAGDVLAQAAPVAADVGVTVGAEGVVQVEERYVMPGGLPSVELRALTRPCADIRNVRVQRSGSEVAGVQLRDGPWLVLRDTTPVQVSDTLRLSVRYEVRVRGGRADIPLMHLAAPVPQRDGEREGPVRLVVRFAEEASRVVFPHMTRKAPTEWGARYVAVPSFVAVSLAGSDRVNASGCAAAGGPPGDSGGLVWRFLLLVGIMGAWVPLYLAWARRTGEDGE